MRVLAILLIIAGFLLMALSPFWSSVAGSSLFWDDASAQDYAESVANLHHAHTEASIEHDPLVYDDENASDGEQAHIHAPAETHTLPAKQRFDEAQRKLVNARRFRNRGGTSMRWLGATIAIIGLSIYQWQKSGTE